MQTSYDKYEIVIEKISKLYQETVQLEMDKKALKDALKVIVRGTQRFDDGSIIVNLTKKDAKILDKVVKDLL